MNSIKPIDRKTVTRLFVTIILILGAVNSNAQNEKSIDRDTFLINNIPFSVEMPKGWWLEQINNGLCSDSTYNYVGVYRGASLQQNATIVIQITYLKPQTYSDRNKPVKKNEQPIFNNLYFADVHAMQFEFPARKKKKCKGCGFEFLDITSTPLSDNRVLNIYFTGNGPTDWMTEREKEYKVFCSEFILSNSYGFTCFSFPLGAEMNIKYTTATFNNIPLRAVFSKDWTPTFDTNLQKLKLVPASKQEFEQYIDITAHYLTNKSKDSLSIRDTQNTSFPKVPKFEAPKMPTTKSSPFTLIEAPKLDKRYTVEKKDPTLGTSQIIFLSQSKPYYSTKSTNETIWDDVLITYTQICFDTLTDQNYLLTVQLRTRVYDRIYCPYYEMRLAEYVLALAQWNHALVPTLTPVPERKSFLIFDTSKFTYTSIKNAASGINTSEIKKKSGE